MTFMNGFADELVKTAAASEGKFRGILKALRLAKSTGRAARATHGGLSLGRAALMTAGAGVGAAGLGEVLGKKRGEKQGYQEGTSDVETVAMRARAIGRQEGVLAYHQALQARLKAAEGK